MWGKKKAKKDPKPSEVNRAPQAKSSGAGPARKKTSTQASKKRPAPAGTQPSARQKKPQMEVLSKQERIPHFEKILTSDSGDIPITEQLQKYYVAVVEKTNKQETVTIYCDPEKSINGYMDNTYQNLKEKCHSKGYKAVTRRLATKSIIEIIYSRAVQNSTSLLDQEQNQYLGDYQNLIGSALTLNATDIHIEVRRDKAKIRFRIDGRLIDQPDWGVSKARRISSMIYQVIASEQETSFNENEPQSAMVDDIINGTGIRLRLNTLNAYPKGFDMVMRVLRMGVTVSDVTLDSLGYATDQYKDIMRMKAKPNGAIFVAGVTGSGKSTTNTVLLSSIIQEKTDEHGCEIKVITVEDPPEYEIPGASQVPVVRSKNKTNENPFAATMRACLRNDPDIILIGEVRDSESAELMQHAIQSGHMVFTTIHAQHAFAIPTRLKGMGLTNDIIGSQGFIAGMIYQALVQLCCASCSYTLDEALELKEFQTEEFQEMSDRIKAIEYGDDGHENVRIRRKGGCPDCNGGVVGRSVVAEVVNMTDELIDLFAEGKFTEARRLYRDQGGKFVVDHAIEKVMEGLVDPRDAESKVGILIPSKASLDTNFIARDPTEEELESEVSLVHEKYQRHPVTPIK